MQVEKEKRRDLQTVCGVMRETVPVPRSTNNLPPNNTVSLSLAPIIPTENHLCLRQFSPLSRSFIPFPGLIDSLLRFIIKGK